MSTSLNQKAYLQKYLGGSSGDKKKKKKKAVKGSGLKIIDDDIDLSKLRTLDGDELDVFDQGEDAPQIAGIIDDRPEEVRKAEQFSSSSKWKIISQDDGFNSKLEVEEIKRDIKQAEKENELIFGKMYSDSEDEKKNDSDLSPPRKQDTENTTKASKSSKKHDSDSDFSPPRKRDARSPKKNNDDRSPRRKDDRTKRNNDRSPNERHENSAKRRDERSPKRRSDNRRKSYDRSPKRRDDRSPEERQNKSTKKRDEKSPKRRNDDKRKNDDKSPKRKSRDRSPKRKSDDKSPRRNNGDKSPKKRNDVISPIKDKSNRNNSNEPATSEKPRERRRKPSRWGDFPPEDPATLQPSNSELSPRTVDPSPPRKSKTVSSPRKNINDESDASPPRKSKKNNDSDQSPPRKSKKTHDSPPRKTKKNQDSDVSPPRRPKGDSRRRGESPEFLSPSKKQRYSPQRQGHKDRYERYQSNPRQDKTRKHRQSSESDLSPPRKSRRDKSVSPPKKNKNPPENSKRKFNSDSDQSPPRRERERYTSERDRSKRANDSPPPSNKKMAKTLEGKLAGLQDARQLRQENESFRQREEEVFNKMTDEVSGRNAQVVSRKSKRETSEERQKLKEKAERQKELDDKYKKWSKGVKQIEDQEARVQDFLHESSKPLARLRDDRDLEDSLKQVERAGDPMLKYMRDRKRERGELGPEKPIYKGQFPPNRFNIRPGYRWDGVDRSNGYEKKYFDQQSKRKAQEEEAYKWSTEDL